MNVLYASVRNETIKIFFRRKAWVLLGLSAVITCIAAAILYRFQSGSGILAVSSMNFPLFVLGIFTGFVLPLYAGMVAVDQFAGEHAERTLKVSLLRPVTRLKVFMSKILSMGIYLLVNMFMILLLSLILGLFLDGANGGLAGIMDSTRAYAAAFLPVMLLGIAAALVSQFTKNPTGAFTLCIVLFMASKLAATIFPAVSGLMVTSFSDWHLLWSAKAVPVGKIINVFMLMVSYSIIFLAAGFYLFDRKEL